jgi:pyruvate dehydrogenase E1 component alpha subunit
MAKDASAPPQPSRPSAGGQGRDQLIAAYRTMRTIREFEERVHQEFAAGQIPGAVHLYAGQEAVATGVCAALAEGDYIASTHRGHGHAIAKGCDLTGMMLEIYGKAGGLCGGKGGSMHIADFDRGMLGSRPAACRWRVVPHCRRSCARPVRSPWRSSATAAPTRARSRKA